ncbi:MAG: CRISPR-associated endonuclease Cas3'' [Candidatus Caldarchaeum sp.]|nr:CRISPR-associated endonuclease Cas3'' [Candidatus Caldarchaeum sp.]
MKPCAFEHQSLTQHLISVTSKADAFVSRGYIETLCTRLERAGVAAEQDTVRKLVSVTAFFHDVGKAVKYYQERFDDGCVCVKGKCSFYLHELLSAVYVKRYLLRSRDCDERLRTLAVLAVMNHMHALRDYASVRGQFGPEISGRPRHVIELFQKTWIERPHLDKILEAAESCRFLDIDVLRQTLSNEVEFGEVQSLLGDAEREEENRRSYLKLYVLLLLPVVLGDNLDAVERRRNDEQSRSRKAFLDELRYLLGERL